MKMSLAIALTLFAAVAVADPRYPMLSPCTANAALLCGTIEVPEVRRNPNSRRLTLEVMVIPARAEKPLSDPIVPITGGGPGIASIPDATSWQDNYPELHERRDMIFWNQRGTGPATALDCPLGGGAAAVRALLGGDLPLDLVRECRDRLAANADLRAYTTADAADDLEDVIRWLHIERVNVYGSSYTSRLALVFAQRHPKRVRTLTLKAAMPPTTRNPLYVARETQAAVDRLFADCAADAKCSASYPTVRDDFAAVLAALTEKPVPIGDVQLTRDVFSGVVRRMLYDVNSQAALPLVITAAKHGDYAPLRPILGAGDRIDQLLNLGLFLSVTCAEDAALFTMQDVEREARGTFSGPMLATAVKRACGDWPSPSAQRHDYGKVVKGVPALVISGVYDPGALEAGREMSRLLTKSVHLEVEGQAHTGSPACLRSVVVAFIESGSNASLPTACLASMKRPPFR